MAVCSNNTLNGRIYHIIGKKHCLSTADPFTWVAPIYFMSIPCWQTNGPTRKYICSDECPVSPSHKETRGNKGQFPTVPMSVVSLLTFKPQLHCTVPVSVQ